MAVLLVFIAFLMVCTQGHSRAPLDFTLQDALPIPFQQRVVGGQEAAPGEFPYIVSLRSLIPLSTHFCGGSVISNRWVLTAAHCTDGRTESNTTVVAGTNDRNGVGQLHLVVVIVIHESYLAPLTENDVSVVQTATAIQYNQRVQPVGLAQQNPAAGTAVVLTGWGRTSYPGELAVLLQKITLTTVSLASCRQSYEGSGNTVYDSQICTFTEFGEGSCHGDSGGPLVDPLTGQQVGIVSWGISCARGFPDVYTSVFSFRGWISIKTGIVSG